MAFLKSAETHMKDGKKHLQAKEYEKALKSFQNAEKKKPEDPSIMNYLSQTYAGMNDLDTAVDYILKAITQEPQSPIHRQLYATYLMRQGKNYDAIPVIDETLELQPVDVIYILRGQADYNLGNMDSALEFFDKALELDANHPLANHMMGLVLYRLRRYSEAIPHIETALSVGELGTLREILEDCREKINR
ncbi:tetratricopeptide repeat protein [Candidatus Bathyarchaeota archaeon]|nr:MAG: tetratricopeptide repeat protein [Candidatus Bathyarchaeota archaeon]